MAFSLQDTSGTPVPAVAGVGLGVALPTDPADAGLAVVAGESDDGTGTGTPVRKPGEISDDFRLRTGIDTLLFSTCFAGAALDTGKWNAPSTTMTIVQTAGILTFNAGNSVASGAVAQVTSRRFFPAYGAFGVSFEGSMALLIAPQLNNVAEWGAGLATGVAVPTQGAFFRLNAAAELRAVTCFNSIETESAVLDNALLGAPSKMNRFAIVVSDAEANFFLNDLLVAQIALPTAQGLMMIADQTPVFFRLLNSAVTGSAQQMRIGSSVVTLIDAGTTLDEASQMSGMGAMGYQGQLGGTMGSTALYVNSADATPAVPTNTTAALGSGLGGQFAETNSLALGTDGVISSFQVPVGTISLPGMALKIYGIKISSFVQTVLTGGGNNEQWTLAFGHTAVSLATVENATQKAPRRLVLGSRAVAAAAAAGTALAEISLQLKAPITVNPGEFVQTVVKRYGTVGLTGTIKHLISFDCHWV